MTYLIEYLGEFEFILETVLGYVSGDQMGSFEAKKMESKISCLGTFKNELLSAVLVQVPRYLLRFTSERLGDYSSNFLLYVDEYV